MLYVALTRTTRHLDIVCVGDPLPLSAPEPPPEPEVSEEDRFPARDVQRLAEHLAARLRSAAPQPAWPHVLDQMKRLLDPPEEPPPEGPPPEGQGPRP